MLSSRHSDCPESEAFLSLKTQTEHMFFTTDSSTSPMHKISMRIIQYLVPLTTTECNLRVVVIPYRNITQYNSRNHSSHGDI